MLRKMVRSGRTAYVAVLLLSAASLGISQAQTTTGEVTGRVVDASEALVSGAEVTVRHEETGLERRVASNAEGYFAATFLPLGTYSVTVAAPGFKMLTRSGLRIGGGQRIHLALAMEVGAVTDSVTVSATAQQVNTEDAKLRHVIDQKQAQNLALNGRVLTHMLALIPGVAITGDLSAFDITGNLGNFAVNGSRTVYNAATVDGGFNQDSGNMASQSNLVSPDFVEEVSIVTSGYTAEYGRSSGVQINFATRSGTKNFHGVLYEFFRNEKMDARSFFAPRKNKLRYNNFGWTLGGPVTLPGKFNRSREKLFFFVGQEHRRRTTDQIQFATTPTGAERSGIINSPVQLTYPSNFPVVSLRGQPISDPSRATPGNSTGRNIIPQQYITANGRAVMKIYETMIPRAVTYVDQAVPNNTAFQLPNPDTRREDFVKVDYLPSAAQRLTYTLMNGVGTNDTQFVFGPYPTKGFTRRNVARTHRINWTQTISPTTVNRVAAQVNHLNLRWPPLGDYDRADRYGLAIKELYGNDIQEIGIPNITIQGFSGISGAAGAWQAPTADFSVSDDLNYVRGKHNLRFGFLAARNRKNEAVLETTRLLTGNVAFSQVGNTVTSGDALADVLLGNFRSWREAQYPQIEGVRYTQAEAYVNDTWRVLPNLSMDIGVRYTYTIPNYSAAGNVSTFLGSAFDPAKAQQVIPSGVGAGSLRPGVGDPYNGIVIPGSQFYQDFERRFPPASSPEIRALFRGLPRSIFPNIKVLAPRFGFAYDPWRNGKVSIRGGAGFYTDVLPTGFFREMGSNPPFGVVSDVVDGPIDDPGRGAAGAKFPVSMLAMGTDIQPPLTLKANFGFQIQLPTASVLDVSWVTSQARHNLRRVDINTVHPSVQFNNRTVNLNALRRYQGYASINSYESSASSNYHGLQVGLTRRYSTGVTYSLAYTFSKALDDGSALGIGVEDINNYRAERSYSDLDRTHVVTMSYIYELPFWRSGQRWYEKALGEWTISGINVFQSGPRVTPSIVTPTGFRRPDRVGELKYLDPRQVQTLVGGDGQSRTGNFWFDPGPGGAFIAPAPDRFGNSAPRIIRGPGRNNWNIALMKDFPVSGERVKLKFRAETFNVWNHAQFNSPNLTASDRAYGIVSSSADGRNVQLGLKLEW